MVEVPSTNNASWDPPISANTELTTAVEIKDNLRDHRVIMFAINYRKEKTMKL